MFKKSWKESHKSNEIDIEWVFNPKHQGSGDRGSGDKDDKDDKDKTGDNKRITPTHSINNNNNGYQKTRSPLKTERPRFSRTRKPTPMLPATTKQMKTIPAEWSKVDINRYGKTTESPQMRFYNDKRLTIRKLVKKGWNQAMYWTFSPFLALCRIFFHSHKLVKKELGGVIRYFCSRPSFSCERLDFFLIGNLSSF